MEDNDFGIDDEDEEDEDKDNEALDSSMDVDQLWQFAKRKGFDMDELRMLLAEAAEAGEELTAEQPPAKRRKVNGKAEKSQAKEKQKKAAKKTKPAKPIFDLEEPTYGDSSKTTNPSSTSSSSRGVDVDPYGELTSLQHADATDKSARRKTLRFHTSKIESAGRRREGARTALGGDDDVPYRERRREKEARMAKEAAKRGLGQGGEDLDMDLDGDGEGDFDVEAEDGMEGVAKGKGKRKHDDIDDGSADEEGPDGYYELVKKKSKEAKQQKKADYEAARAAERPNFDEGDLDGPRAPTRAILANKGLTPRRSKEQRNPRVKKRKRFEKAKRKVSSQKAIYRGGEGKGYEGEKSGISKVVKATRLG
jgi:U3 small nucleolar RNA-associated protein 3